LPGAQAGREPVSPSPTAPQRQREPRGDPTVATLLGWFVPGAGHLFLGEVVAAVVVFALVGGLYFLGLSLADGMTFEFLDPELRGALAPLLSPESGTLGGFVWQQRQYGYGPGFPRLFPDTVRLGSALCATAGVLNVVTMVHVHLFARLGDLRASLRPAALVGLAWLVPGLGHFLQGRRLRAAIVFGLLVGLFVVGTLLAEGSNLSRERHFYYWAGQFLLGAPALAAEALFGSTRVTGPIPYAEAGLVYGCVAGLLNVLAMIDVYGWAEARVLGLDPRVRGGEQPAGGGEARA
jgi:TM2 domain-containing membrane protein YozV